MCKREVAVKKAKLAIVVIVAGGDGKFQPTRKVTFGSLSADLYQEPHVTNTMLHALGVQEGSI